PDRKSIVPVVRDVLERYDSALESLSKTEEFPFNEENFADELVRQIVTVSYVPTPNTAFLVRKKSGLDRMVEQPSLRDLIVQQYILKTISRPFDRIFEESSIGFRKGMSRQKAVEMVQAAIKEGHQYVIESDIEDFFPSVDLEMLERLIGLYLPEKDLLLKDLIIKTIRNGYMLNGAFCERTKGLAQGSPLSPVFANLFLDSFDEEIMKWNVRMIRYADDFVIMARTKEEAENILSRTETVLSNMGLKLKKEKTSIVHIKEGFRFLGMKFGESEAVVEPEEEFSRLLKKPLYITAPYCFLSLNGETVDIKKSGEIIETVPLRRISEIIVMEKASFSTALITRCTEDNIPFTLTLNSGYYVTTIKPDSKKYHDISFAHARRFYSLTDTEALSIAKEFAACKLNNYISLFKQRYGKDMIWFIREMESAMDDIYQAGDVHQVRGFEGAAAKKVYPKLNSIIDDSLFHITKRDRKTPDRINSLLNFGYYLLFSRINATVRAAGLNPYLGFLHSPEDNFESLVCDIEELFRARIDRFIIRMINLKVIKNDDLAPTEKGFYLSGDARKRFLDQFEAEMERRVSARTLSLKENIYVQTAVIKNYVLQDKPLTFYRWDV
ncbi:MAG: CRISPR-associated endonuclease Cas1, partial [Nitrospirota bacterium]|nr:CRISPR-associated endonuclease Cas1 [Nitrospirota bacterium]